MFSDQVLAHPSVKDKFNEALDIMNRAVSSNVGEQVSQLGFHCCDRHQGQGNSYKDKVQRFRPLSRWEHGSVHAGW